MGATPEEIRNIFQNFRWIDDIPEDQDRRDEICLQGKAALLLEANIDSEMMPAFLRLDRALDHYDLPQPISFILSDGYDKNRDTVVTLRLFEFGNLNEFKKLWGPYAALPPPPYNHEAI